MLSKYDFTRLFPNASIKNLNLFYEPLTEAMKKYQINTPARIAMFVANIAHESGSLSRVVENMNYSAKRLREVFPGYFVSEVDADLSAHNPEKIANRVYANRMGNGDAFSGDGWRFRGRGLIGVTGRENYAKVGKALGIDLISHPELLEQPKYSALSACWFWYNFGLNQIADTGDFVRSVKRINGGLIGLADRQERYDKARQIIGSVKLATV